MDSADYAAMGKRSRCSMTFGCYCRGGNNDVVKRKEALPAADGRQEVVTKSVAGNLKPRTGKAPLHLIPARANRVAAAGFEDGAEKYAPWNFRDHGEGVREMYSGALLRHATAFADPGESDYAADSGIHHLAHARACLDILIDLLGVDYPARDPALRDE